MLRRAEFNKALYNQGNIDGFEQFDFYIEDYIKEIIDPQKDEESSVNY